MFCILSLLQERTNSFLTMYNRSRFKLGMIYDFCTLTGISFITDLLNPKVEDPEEETRKRVRGTERLRETGEMYLWEGTSSDETLKD